VLQNGRLSLLERSGLARQRRNGWALDGARRRPLALRLPSWSLLQALSQGARQVAALVFKSDAQHAGLWARLRRQGT